MEKIYSVSALIVFQDSTIVFSWIREGAFVYEMKGGKFK